MDKQRALDAALRTDFLSFLAKAFGVVSGGDKFARNWHHEAIAAALGEIERGANTRLIVTIPPRNLKSITISVAWVAWMLGHNPGLRFVAVSYSADLAQKHASDCRAIMLSDWYRRLFPKTRIAKGSAAEMDWETTAGGGRLSTSIAGMLTGRGGDIIVVDDPIKPEDANSDAARRRVLNWYSNTLSSQLNDKTRGSIILVMQRLHEEDLAGHLLSSGSWKHHSLSAIAEEDQDIQIDTKAFYHRKVGEALHPERESVAKLLDLKVIMGAANFSAQYQQSPVPAEGLYVKKEWFQYWADRPEKDPGDKIVQSWDTASKDGAFSDWSVCVTALVRRGEVSVLDVFRAKLLFPDLKHKAIELARTWGIDVLLIEDAASGQQLLQVLKRTKPLGIPRPIARKPEGDKISRFSGQTHRIEAGELFLPKQATWLAEFERELLGFPNLRHDDQVDAITQLLAWTPRWSGPSVEIPDFGPRLFEGDSGLNFGFD